MSQVIRQGFRTMYEILETGSIKPGGSGTMTNGSLYKASVKFRSQNIVERMDPRVGLQEVETIIEYKIPCDSEVEAIAVAEVVRKLRSNKTNFYLSGDLPITHQDGKKKDVVNVTSFDTGAEFLKQHASPSEPKQTLKS